jgi:hypothetical protein
MLKERFLYLQVIHADQDWPVGKSSTDWLVSKVGKEVKLEAEAYP